MRIRRFFRLAGYALKEEIEMKPTGKQPLFVVTGASCVGKSALCEVLFQKEKEYLVLESDQLWDDRWNTPEDGYAAYRSMWMRLCAQVSQIGKPVVLCGCALPEQFETRPERELFTEIYYLAAVCQEETLRRRAADGRGVTEQGWIDSSLQFNGWLRENAGKTVPPITLLDTTALTAAQAAEAAHTWIMKRLDR